MASVVWCLRLLLTCFLYQLILYILQTCSTDITVRSAAVAVRYISIGNRIDIPINRNIVQIFERSAEQSLSNAEHLSEYRVDRSSPLLLFANLSCERTAGTYIWRLVITRWRSEHLMRHSLSTLEKCPMYLASFVSDAHVTSNRVDNVSVLLSMTKIPSAAFFFIPSLIAFQIKQIERHTLPYSFSKSALGLLSINGVRLRNSLSSRLCLGRMSWLAGAHAFEHYITK